MSPTHRSTSIIAPTLLALGAMGGYAYAADPTFSVAGGAAQLGTTPVVTIEWTDDMGGWDPLTVTNLEIYDKATAPVIGTDTPTAVVQAKIDAATTHSFSFHPAALTHGKLWVRIPTLHAYKLSAPTGTLYPTAGNAAATQVYTVISSAAAATVNSIASPTNNSTTSQRSFIVSAQVNIDDDESTGAANTVAINPEYGTTDLFTLTVKDGGTAIASKTFTKATNVPAVLATPTSNRQFVAIPLTSALTVGVHTLTTTVTDPLNRAAATVGTSKVLIWDPAVLNQVNGLSAPGGTPTAFTIDRTNSIVLTGSRFSVGSDTSTVTCSIDSGAVTVAANSATDPTKFSFAVASLPQGSHTVVITQTYSAAGLGGAHPTILSSYTIDNSTANLDTTAPVEPTIATPTDAATVTTLKPTISGYTEPNALVDARYSTDGATWTNLVQVTADATGAFTFNTTLGWNTIAALAANSTYFIQVKATDAAGNASLFANDQISVTTPAAAIKVAVASTTNLTTGTDGNKYSNGANPVLTLGLTNLDGTANTTGAIGTGAAALTTSDVTVTGGTAVVAGSVGAGYTITVTPAATNPTTVTVALPQGAFTIDGVANEAMTSYTFIRDAAVPTFTTTISTGTSTTAINANPTIVLAASKVLSAKDKTKVVLAFTPNTATGTTLPTLDNGTFSADKKTVTYTCSGGVAGTATGMSLTFTSGAVTDLAGNVSAAVSTAVTRTLDVTALDITSVASTVASPGKVSPIPFTFTFTEPTYGLTLANIDVTNGIATGLTGAGSATYTLTVVPGEGPTPVKAGLKAGTVLTDAVGNSTTFASVNTAVKHYLTRIYDSTPPRVTSLTSSVPAPTATDTKPTNKTSIPCSIVFSEPVSGLTASSFQVDNGSISSLSGSGSAYTFSLDVAAPLTASKQVRVLLASNKVTDVVANQNSSVAVLVRNYDGVVPTLDFATPTLTGTAGTAESKANFVVSLNNGGTSDVLSTKFDKTQITTSLGTIESITPTTSGNYITGFTAVVVFPRSIGAAVTLTANPGTVTDVAGNKNVSSSATLTVPGAG